MGESTGCERQGVYNRWWPCNWSTDGYICEECGAWVPAGTYHICCQPRYRYTYDINAGPYDDDLIATLKRLADVLERLEKKLT